MPTMLDWVLFVVSMLLVGYAALAFLADRVPGLAGAGAVTRKASRKLFLIFVDRVGGWLVQVYAAIWRAFVGLLRTLWSGPRPDPEPAPVSTIFVPLPASYVAGSAEIPPPDAPSAPSAVRPSAPSAALPPAVAQLMADRSREALILALVAAGWSTTQIRTHLRGANDAIGAEVEAARQRLEAPRQTPVAGRETDARFPPGQP